MECICEKLRKDTKEIEELAYDCYTSLRMGYGWIEAAGEGCAREYIRYCPFCGKEFIN